MTQLPDYIIIGAMKCGTSTLAAQLGAQDGVFMTTPKEPNFFSDDRVYAKGLDWYGQLFGAAAPGDLLGEASTHYTKRPDYPDALDRLLATGARPRLIYMIRNPLDRAVSHYIHEWTESLVNGSLQEALVERPSLIHYSCYAEQITPWVEAFGRDQILVLSLEAMKADPQGVLDRAGAFLGRDGLVWQEDLERVNVSADRMRRLPLQEVLIHHPIATWLRRLIVPKAVRETIRHSRQMRERPVLTAPDRRRLETLFAEDYARLQDLFPNRPDLALSYPFVDA